MDKQRLVVTRRRLKIAGANAREDWGYVTDVRALAPSASAKPTQRVDQAIATLCIAALVLPGSLIGAGVPDALALPATGTVLASGLFFLVKYRRRKVSPEVRSLGNGGGTEQRVLVDERDRAAFVEALDLAKRVHRSVLDLQGLVDPASTDLALAHALWEYADVLVRRQEIRAVRDELLRQNDPGLPQESPVVAQLRDQIDRTEVLWQEIEAEAGKHLQSLSAMAKVNERFIRERSAEREIGEAVRWAEESLNRIAPVASSNLPLASEQLADETAEVLTAYRELMSRYGQPG